MCGIAGFIQFEGQRPDEAAARVKRMTDALTHRGPDDEGFFVDAHVAFGHRRLAIIDVATGQQPMPALGGQVQIVFNGEIYNYREVRAALEARGHQFRTHSDTEVILLGYVEWGEHCIERLNGMFAFAIWDARTRQILLARDRTGEKPLYYWRNGTTLAFGSEIKALRAGGMCDLAIDPESLDCYLSFGYVPAPRTIHRNVRKLRAAHALVANADGQRERRYWSLSFADPVDRSAEAATEELEALLDESVRSRLMSEVPLGAFLSGGIDSSLIVSSMSRAMSRPVITHSIGFGDRQDSELPAAARIAAHLGTDHHELTVTPKAAEVVERIAWHFDEPVADSSAVPTWYVCEMARKSVTVALSGDGGDEAFGGYTFRYRPHVLESAIRRRLPPLVRGPLFGTLGAAWPGSARLPGPMRLKTIFENLAVGDAEAFYRDLVWLRPDSREMLYSAPFRETLRGFTPMETVQPYYCHNDAPDPLGRSQYTDMNFYMTDDVLAKVDRMSMAHSLEVRAPFLDHRILEFAARLPFGLKMKGREGKVILRSLATKCLPDDIRKLPKRGFSIPGARWLRGELRDLASPILFAKDGLISQILDAKALKRLWSEHQVGARDHHVVLWGLMMLGLWERNSGVSSRENL